MTTLQEQLQTAVEQSFADSAIFHNIVHGNESTEVTTENGKVKSVAKVVAENQRTLSASINTITEMRDTSVYAAQTAVEAAEEAQYAAQGNASAIHVEATESLISTDVQSALVELDNKKINQSQIGNQANQLVKLDEEAKLPEIDGSKLLNVFSLPTGTILDYVGNIAPDGYLICDGSSYQTSNYPNLFALIGYMFGGAGAVFNIPDLRRKTTIGAGGTATTTIGNAIGNTGGTERHTLTIDEMPNHNHSMNQGNSGYSGVCNLGTSNLINNLYSNYTGGGQSHNNMQPSMVVNKIIKT